MAAIVSRSAVKAIKATPAKVAAPVAPKANKFMVWQPVNNKMFETFSYLPPLSDSAIAKQVEYLVRNGFVPCLEFADSTTAYVQNTNTVRFGNVSAGYYDNRYWPMWKLPMFGCTDPDQVLREISACRKAFPDAYIRVVAFDNVRQVQIGMFLVHRPTGARDYRKPADRSVA